MTLSHFCDFSSSNIKCYSGEIGIYLSSISYLSLLQKSAKLKISTSIGVICWGCKRVTGMNIIAFTSDGIKDTKVALLFRKNLINIEEIEEFICYILSIEEKVRSSQK